MKRGLRTIRATGLLALVGSAALLVGAANAPQIVAVAKDRYEDLQIFAKVLNLVQNHYVEPVETKKLIYGAIKGMLQVLDPHTTYLPPEMLKEFENETSGEFGGLGIEITLQNDMLTVISPIEDTPAWLAGIKAGDRIVEINGESTKGMTLAEAAQRMRGKRGSKVKMLIFRDGFEKPKEFAVARGVVRVKSVKYTDLGEGYAYVRLTSFIENSGPELEKALKKHEREHSGIKGLVLDLRRNPGGLLDQAVRVSDLFLEEGTIVSTILRDKKQKELIAARKEGTLPDFPMIILINEYSASASEIVAGALQDNKRALIMGQRSFGKGSVQSVMRLADGSGLKLTIARYYTPNGASIQAEGINPDVVIDEVDPEQFQKAVVKRDVRRERDIERHLRGDHETGAHVSGTKGTAEAASLWWMKQAARKAGVEEKGSKEKLLGQDFQLLQAVNYLRAWKVMESFRRQASSLPVQLNGPPKQEK